MELGQDEGTRFSAGEKAEAVDSVGCWSLCTVKEVRDGGYYVGFDGWNSKWNLLVNEKEIRQVTHGETVGCKRTTGTGKTRKSNVAFLHLERGDIVMVHSNADGIKEAEVVTVDPMNNCLEVMVEGTVRVMEPGSLVETQTEAEVDEEPGAGPSQSKRKKVVPRPCKPVEEVSNVPLFVDNGQGPQQPTTGPEEGAQPLLPTAPGADGYRCVGDICSYENVFTVIVTSIFLLGELFYAKCLICKPLDGNLVVGTFQGDELTCLTSHLFKATYKSNSKIAKVIRSYILKHQQSILTSSATYANDTEYQRVLRRVRIARQISTDIQNMLGGKSFKRTFEYVINEADYAIFGLCSENNFDVTYLLEDGFEFLDRLLFAMWDVKCNSTDPSSKYYLVRSIRVKANLHSLIVAVVKVQSSDVFYSKEYREMAMKSLYAVQTETGVPLSSANCTPMSETGNNRASTSEQRVATDPLT